MATLAPTPSLTTAEWRAVSIALNDASRCGCVSARQSFLGRLFTAITGIEPQRPLADARLEAIRQFVCTARRKPNAVEQMMPVLEQQGFSHAQAEALALLSR